MATEKAYPLITKKQIQARIATDPAFVAECVSIIHTKFLARRSDTTEHGGWMASQAVEGERIAKKFNEGKQSAADIARATGMVKQYSRALAVHFRTQQLLQHPELTELAALYGVTAVSRNKPNVQASAVVPTVQPDEPSNEAECDSLPTAVANSIIDDSLEIIVEPATVTSADTGGDVAPTIASQRIAPVGLDSRVLNCVTKNPGTRSEVIALDFRTDTSEISASLRRLVDTGWVRREGLARWTKYFAIQ